MSNMRLVVGKPYNWIHGTERLVYLGQEGLWHQFAKIDEGSEVWCECLDNDLDLELIEETKEEI